MAMTKTQLDNAIRTEGLKAVSLEGLTQVDTASFVGEMEVDGTVRFFEIKVMAKSVDYDVDDAVAAYQEKVGKAKDRAEAAAASKAKREADKAKKAKEKAEKDA